MNNKEKREEDYVEQFGKCEMCNTHLVSLIDYHDNDNNVMYLCQDCFEKVLQKLIPKE